VRLARKPREMPEAREAKVLAVSDFGTQADKSIYTEACFDQYFQSHLTY
jgi:hypothetical protein